MDAPELSNANFNVDYETILPIHQKRTIAFINNFITNTVSFLNQFAQSCESRLMEFEYKVQKVEASLLILESQLASIPEINENNNTIETPGTTVDLPIVQDINEINQSIDENMTTGVTASHDPRFVRFFKMVQVGVPVQAVKNKMRVEGLDPDILDKPNETVPDNIQIPED